MDDQDLIRRISELVEEEHRLERGSGELGTEEQDRLRAVEVQLDQCWDLLRQRRARRHAGDDPSEATVRDTETVETYQQ